MAELHPVAMHHLPPFVTAPGETDVLFLTMAVVVLVMVVGLGVFYFKLHALPEQMAHRGQKVQFQIVAVLGLIALFTHNHAFWIAGLLLALVPFPDFATPLSSIARSLERIAAGTGSPGVAFSRATPPLEAPPPPVGDTPVKSEGK